jgi:hypothetical protein
VQNRAPASRAAHDVDTGGGAGFEIEKIAAVCM